MPASNQTRSYNTVRNIIFGFVNRTIGLALPFAVRTIIIYKLGAEYVGVNSLFVSILQVLSVAELGFASAISFALYAPVASDDTDKIIELVGLLRSIYLVVGAIILVVGLGITPFIPFLIKGDVPPDINVYVIYLIYLLNTALTYFVFGYKNSILNVYQRYDVISKINTFVEILRDAAQITLLLVFSNFYAYIVALPVFTLLSNLLVCLVANRMHPELAVKTRFSLKGIKGMRRQLGGIAIGRISLVCRNSLDSIILSSVLGLTITAIYSNYYLIFTAITSFLVIFLTSMAASIGNALVTKPMELNEQDHLKFDFYFMLIVGVCTVFLFSLYQPFMSIWVGKELMFEYRTMVFFCVYFYSNGLAQIRALYSEAAGLWWRFVGLSITEMVANLGLNIGLGIWIGVDGIIIATIITSFLCSFIGKTILTYKYLFEVSSFKYFILNAFYLFMTLIVCVGVYFCERFIELDGWPAFLSMAGIAVLASSILVFAYLVMPKTRRFLFDIKTLLNRRKGQSHKD